MGVFGRNYRQVCLVERNHTGMGAVGKDMLLIMFVISIAQVTGRGGIMDLQV